MASVGEFFAGLFAFLGPWGSLVALLLIFVVDAMLIPTLPEIWFVLTLSFAQPPTEPAAWRAFVLLMAVAGEAIGNSLLYAFVKKAFIQRGRMPKSLDAAMRKWTGFLLVHDERLILVNRVAPVVPMVGAFIAALNWSYPKSLAYIVIGAAAKYGALLVLVAYIQVTYDPAAAASITFVLALAVVATSAILSLAWRRRTAHRAPDPSISGGRTRPPQSGGP